MLAAFSQKFGHSLRQAVPLVSSFVFVLVSVLNWPLPYFGAVAPDLSLVAVYYWAIYRPDLFRPLSAFLLGLIFDGISGFPLGLTAFVFVGVHYLAYSQRRFFVGQIFYMLWSGYALVCLLSMFIKWLLFVFLSLGSFSFSSIAAQFAMSVLLFPLPAWVLIRLQRSFLPQNE